MNPTSTMGATKLLGERLFISANHYVGNKKTRFANVRFGNVLDTNGSFLQIFKDQIKNNVPLTITSTDMTRFFITMNQAVNLCISALDVIIGGEVFILNMGSCSVLSIAKALCGNKNFEYEIIGPKFGEKIYEELVTETEAKRTVLHNELYTIIPDTLDLMPNNIIEKYEKIYQDLPRINKSIRSDKDLLTDNEVASILKDNNLLY